MERIGIRFILKFLLTPKHALIITELLEVTDSHMEPKQRTLGGVSGNVRTLGLFIVSVLRYVNREGFLSLCFGLYLACDFTN